MSKTALQKARRQVAATLPRGETMVLDEALQVVVTRRSTLKWHVRFAYDDGERPLLAARLSWLRRFPVATVVRCPNPRMLGPDEKEYEVLFSEHKRWHDTLGAALDDARQTIVSADAVKRLRGESAGGSTGVDWFK